MSLDEREGLHNDTSTYQSELKRGLRARNVRGCTEASGDGSRECGDDIQEVVVKRNVERNEKRNKELKERMS